MGRQTELLKKAAEEFRSMRSPFEGEWLAEHDVSLDECGNLSDGIAMAIDVYLATPSETRIRLLAEAVLRKGSR